MATSTVCDFLSQEKQYAMFLSSHDLRDGDKVLNSFKELVSKGAGSDREKMDCVETAFKDELRRLINTDSTISQFIPLLDFTLVVIFQNLCSPTIIFSLLSDLADCSPITQCEELFSYIEGKTQHWKSEQLYAKGRNHLLKMCNDILKKLSKSQNTVFCGRIQLFLARLFPLTEKSGLNLHSEFNLDNLTIFSQLESADVVPLPPTNMEKEKMETDASETTTTEAPVDYYFYTRFWSLQDFFRDPGQCYRKALWNKFVSYSDAVLNAFDSAKLDDAEVLKQRRQLEQLKKKQRHVLNFFAKFLTSEKLLNLQLSDGNFRRYILVQFLIIFQYFTEENKFRNPQAKLSDNQNEWIKKTSKLVYKLIEETPPEGKAFCNIVKHLLCREQNWNAWKNDGCPKFLKDVNPNEKRSRLIVRKRSMVDDLNITEKKQFNLGNAELNRLWNLNQDNDAIIRSDSRQFLPTVETYFEEAIMQSDPVNEIENAYKDVYKTGWQWRALRLLSKKSKLLFEQTVTPGRKVPDYLEDVMKKLAKEITPSHDVVSADQSQEEVDLQSNQREEEEALDEEPEEVETVPPTKKESSNDDEVITVASDETITGPEVDIVSNEKLNLIASLLLDKWELVAEKLAGVENDDIEYFKAKTTPEEQAKNMLTVWKEIAQKKATAEVLKIALIEAGLNEIADKVFSSHS